MNPFFEIIAPADGRSVELHRKGGGLLLRYIAVPDTPLTESPRPYAHPVNTLRGECLTLFRPNDHPWHHALSFTLTSVSGHNFWGGPSYRQADGYRHRDDQGTQQHEAWIERSAERVAHTLVWRARHTGDVLLREERSLRFSLVHERAWSLRWQASLTNVSGRLLELGHYRAPEGLVGSHYSGLQFRGTRDLLDDHGDGGIGIFAEGGREGEAAVHGAPVRWMEWRGQRDGTLNRVSLRFENEKEPLHVFVRRNYPLAAFPLHFDAVRPLAADASLTVDHTLTFMDL